MFQSYGIGYEEYNRKLENRMKVEKAREKDYHKSISIVNEYNRQMHA
ncbi:hypothetical protein ACERII_21280 [Evansella sp. AB-rgal1]